MGKRKIDIRQSVAQSIAEVAWFIESKGMVATAEKFSDSVYDFIELLADDRVTHSNCRDPHRNLLGMKCINFSKKYTVVFTETENLVVVHEFLPSKLIRW